MSPAIFTCSDTGHPFIIFPAYTIFFLVCFHFLCLVSHSIFKPFTPPIVGYFGQYA